jgi:hypothetical protein
MLQQIAWLAAQVPLLRPMIIACFERRPYGAGGAGWNFQHPYDRAHGVRTSPPLYTPLRNLASSARHSGKSQKRSIATLSTLAAVRVDHFL